MWGLRFLVPFNFSRRFFATIMPVITKAMQQTEGYERYSHIGVTAESTLRSEIDALISENGNGGSGNSDVAKTDADYTLYAVVAVCCIALVITGIIVAKKRREKLKGIKKRSAHIRRRR